MGTAKYMQQNKLTLNGGKTYLMVFKNDKLPTVVGDEFKRHSLKPSNECRYLGVVLDKELTYKKQLKMVISKIA